MATISTTSTPFGLQRVGTVARAWKQDEPVFLADHASGRGPFKTVHDAVAGAAYMSQTGKVSDEARVDKDSVFAIVPNGDAFNAVQLLQPVWKRHLGVERMVDTANFRADNPRQDGASAKVDFLVLHGSGYDVSSSQATGTLRLQPNVVAVVGNGWAVQNGTVTTVDGSDRFPPPPPPPPPPAPPSLKGDLTSAIDQIKQSIEQINTVPVTDKGDASTKDARIAAYHLNMGAQDLLQRQFERTDEPAEVISALRTADAHLEDANWQLAKKPSPDGRFTGVDIPGALRDSQAAVDGLTELLAKAPAEQ